LSIFLAMEAAVAQPVQAGEVGVQADKHSRRPVADACSYSPICHDALPIFDCRRAIQGRNVTAEEQN
jgi:hypothetical protein